MKQPAIKLINRRNVTHNHRRFIWLAAIIVCVVFGWLSGSCRVAVGDDNDWLIKHPAIQQMLRFTNDERARRNLSGVKLNDKMCLAAQKHAVWMAKTGQYDHSGLPWSEVIHHGPCFARDAVRDWIRSPLHYAIMLSGTDVGFGYMMIKQRQSDGSTRYLTYWVGLFQ